MGGTSTKRIRSLLRRSPDDEAHGKDTEREPSSDESSKPMRKRLSRSATLNGEPRAAIARLRERVSSILHEPRSALSGSTPQTSSYSLLSSSTHGVTDARDTPIDINSTSGASSQSLLDAQSQVPAPRHHGSRRSVPPRSSSLLPEATAYGAELQPRRGLMVFQRVSPAHEAVHEPSSHLVDQGTLSRFGPMARTYSAHPGPSPGTYLIRGPPFPPGDLPYWPVHRPCFCIDCYYRDAPAWLQEQRHQVRAVVSAATVRNQEVLVSVHDIHRLSLHSHGGRYSSPATPTDARGQRQCNFDGATARGRPLSEIPFCASDSESEENVQRAAATLYDFRETQWAATVLHHIQAQDLERVIAAPQPGQRVPAAPRVVQRSSMGLPATATSQVTGRLRRSTGSVALRDLAESSQATGRVRDPFARRGMGLRVEAGDYTASAGLGPSLVEESRGPNKPQVLKDHSADRSHASAAETACYDAADVGEEINGEKGGQKETRRLSVMSVL